MHNGKITGSFRDPSGFVFSKDGVICRQINHIYKENYEHLINSGLYKALVGSGLLIPHEEVDFPDAKAQNAYKIIRAEPVSFISYPYEWCFTQVKNAALTTLRIARTAFEFGMVLKDSSAYNIQFRKGSPVFIDTLSFEKYQQGSPWVAYKQFCQHFLAPLSLMSYGDIRLNQLSRVYIDGVPLDLASALLPFRTYFAFPLFSHIHLHSKSVRCFAGKAIVTNGNKMPRHSFITLIDNLKSIVEKMKWRLPNSEWATYYQGCNYSADGLTFKKQVISEFLDRTKPKTLWDLGANTGAFSRIASDKGIETVSFDIDAACVEKNYLECVKRNETRILPLVLDLANPSPGIGWNNQERVPLMERGPADTVLALALIHHLAISNNLPFDLIAGFFDKICNSLIIEFIPKSDPQVEGLLVNRKDNFCGYTREIFENDFKKYFTIESSVKIKDSERILYLMRHR